MLISIPRPLRTVSINIGGSLHAIKVAPTAAILPAATDENPDDVLLRLAMASFGLPTEESWENSIGQRG
jgi:hypothetical protein